MNNDELDGDAVDHDPKEEDPIVIEDGTFRWGHEEPVCLDGINIRVKKGSLTAVVGTVGSGKSSLVSAMLGEMVKDQGRVNVNGKVAYVPQQAWMQNATVQDNILFSKSFKKQKYENIIDACALRSDFAIFTGGDQTEIGEKGINLSGGQKQRVSLARAVYNDADVYLLDDPLSAVDSHVGKHIFDQVIGRVGLLAGKTRVLVTHGITYLPRTDHIVVLKNGVVSEQGTYQELVERKGDFAEFLLEYMTEGADEEDDEEVEKIKQELERNMGAQEFQRQLSNISAQHKEQKRRQSLLSTSGSEHETSFTDTKPPPPYHQLNPISEKPVKVIDDKSKDEEVEETQDEQKLRKKLGKIIESEATETGSVKLAVYTYYMKNVGILGSFIIIFMQMIYQGSSLGTNVWLQTWSGSELGNSSEPKYRDLYLGVYGALGFVQAFGTMILSVCLALFTLSGSSKMHKTMLQRVLRSPMSFFDTTPVGRIVNRFAKDVDVCDMTLPQNLRQWMSTFANFLGTVIIIMTVIPIFAAVIVPIAFVFFFIQKVYVNSSRQLKRLESVSRSPIYSHFGESITGSSTIRAFNLERRFIRESEEKVDQNQVCYYPSIIANRWLAIRLENIGNIITFAAALFCILDPDSIEPSKVGLVISYALNVTQVLTWLVRMTSDVETNIVAVERIKEYSSLKQEAEWKIQTYKPKAEWPNEGKVSFNNYGMRYREGLDLVVKGINCNIKGGETIGIVGRTGAGKSSLTVALFRLVEAAEGSITIDGIEINSIGLHDLRSKLTIIPQDPVLFSGTLRINLDPFGQYSDDEIWNVLELSHLKEFATSLEAGLEHDIAEGGDNLSVGQRQLVCLARALLRKTKVLILDEATAAVDLETDDLIQQTIRKEFKGCTVLTIAHRLNTIMDYDRIMVLDKGSIKEFDTVDNLLNNEDTIFYSMAKNAGLISEKDEEFDEKTKF